MTATPLAFYALEERPPWMGHDSATAVCAQTDPEVWHPEKGQRLTTLTAKLMCGGCPLLDVCLEWALDHPTQTRYGIWGGMDEKERRAERRRRRRVMASGAVSVREAA